MFIGDLLVTAITVGLALLPIGLGIGVYFYSKKQAEMRIYK